MAEAYGGVAVEGEHPCEKCKVRSDVEGYGTTRLARIIKKANKYLDELSEKRIRPEDLREMIGDETGILLKKSSELE